MAKVSFNEVIKLMTDVRESNESVEDIELRNELKEVYTFIIDMLKKQKAISGCKPPTDDWERYASRLYDLAYAHGVLDAKEGLR